MGSVQDWVTCPKCKEEGTYGRDYYYRTSEEYCTCLYCGYTHNVFLKRDKHRDLVRKMTKRYDLREGQVLYAEAKRDNDGHQILFKSMPVLPTDTKDDLYFFMNLHLCFYPFNQKKLPEKFKMFAFEDESFTNGQYNIFLKDESGIMQLWFIGYDFEIVDGFLEVYEPERVVEEYGGYGVYTTQSGPLIMTHILEEGQVPEITNEIIFASAVIDGKLTVLKENKDN